MKNLIDIGLSTGILIVLVRPGNGTVRPVPSFIENIKI